MDSEEEKAILAAHNAVEDNPANFEPYIGLGMAYFHAGQFDNALAAFQQAIDLNPRAASAYNGIGRVYYHTGPARTAIEAYEQAIALDPHYIDPYYGLGILYAAQLGEYDAAIDTLQRGVDNNPQDAFLVASLGSTYARMGRFEKAIAYLEQAITLQPDNAFAYSWLSIVYLYLKRYDDMISACQREIEIEAGHAPRRLVGYVYNSLGRYDEAIAQLEQAVTLEPGDYEARGALAKVYRTVGRAQDADEQYAIANKMARQDNEYGQACFEAVSGNAEQALTLLKVALTKGQVQPGWARIDPEFAFINDDPRFQTLIEG
jgi:tetratricopeptide (TPR) repeat protein